MLRLVETSPEFPIRNGADLHSTEDLVRRCATGELEAFRSLYASQAARLHGLALRITREHALAADAVQDAFLQIWFRAEQYDRTRGPADAWMAALLRYRAIDIVRRRTREQTGPAVPDLPTDAPDPLEALSASSEGAALWTCLNQLPADRRTLLVRAFVDGLSHSELAASSGEPLGTVKARIRRALMALRQCIDR